MIPRCLIEPLGDPRELADRVRPDDRIAAAAFAAPHRRAEYLTWRAIVYRELGDVRIRYEATGAPCLEGSDVRIGVSHGAGRVAVVFSDRRCAVDIERRNRNFLRVRERYLTDEEAALDPSPDLPAAIWCLKEALYKYAGIPGLDLRRDLRAVGVDFTNGTIRGRIRNGEILRFDLRCEADYLAVWHL